MQLNKKFINIFLHIFTLTFNRLGSDTSITNINLPLDTIEALAWGSDLEWDT